MKYCVLFLFMSISLSAQTQKNSNLLLLKIEKKNDLTIDKHQVRLYVIELDSLNIPIKGCSMMPLLINDFSDIQLKNCINEKKININDIYTTDSFNAVNNYGEENFEKISNNLKNMHSLSNIKIKDLAYSKKIKVSYSLISGKYCIGELTTKSETNYCNEKKVVILSSPITIDNKYKVPKLYTYDVLKSINYNYFMVD